MSKKLPISKDIVNTDFIADESEGKFHIKQFRQQSISSMDRNSLNGIRYLYKFKNGDCKLS